MRKNACGALVCISKRTDGRLGGQDASASETRAGLGRVSICSPLFATGNCQAVFFSTARVENWMVAQPEDNHLASWP